MGQYQTYASPHSMDLAATIQGFTVENDLVKKAVALVKDRRARR